MADSTEDTNFRAFFGCGAEVAMIAWDMLASLDFLPPDAIITHFLWAFMFMKVYATTRVMQTLCGVVDNETMMKYIMKYVHAIAYLESDVVRQQRCPVMFSCCVQNNLTIACCCVCSDRLFGRIGIEETEEATAWCQLIVQT